jgi:hypothetical protein
MEQHAHGRAMPVQTKACPVREAERMRLGSYLGETCWRELRAVDTVEHGICLIDVGDGGALLVEPGLEQMAEAHAIAADYLALASELGEPQTKHPWPPQDERPAREWS